MKLIKRILVAFSFIILGLVLFSLVGPLIFSGDMRAIGAAAFPFIAIIFGIIGFIVGGRMQSKPK